MKTALAAIALAALITPVEGLARDFGGRARQTVTQENFAREHPRSPSSYCHKHRFRLHADDKRRHCHNWDKESWRQAYLALGDGSGGWRRDSRHDGPWDRDRFDADHDRRGGWWGRSFD